MEPARLQDAVDAVPYWYHKIELPGGVVTPGTQPGDPSAYRLGRYDGMRVLDIGAWDGYFTFDAIRRGAREVLAIDDFSDVRMRLDPAEWQAWHTFDLCAKALDLRPPQCQRQELSVYNLSPKQIGMFDAVLFYGTLYHCRHPMLALDHIASVLRPGGELHVETAVCDDYSAYQGGFGHGYPGDQHVAEFYPGDQYGGNPTNWWAPTMRCAIDMLNAAGFGDVKAWKVNSPDKLYLCRGWLTGTRKDK